MDKVLAGAIAVLIILLFKLGLLTPLIDRLMKDLKSSDNGKTGAIMNTQQKIARVERLVAQSVSPEDFAKNRHVLRSSLNDIFRAHESGVLPASAPDRLVEAIVRDHTLTVRAHNIA